MMGGGSDETSTSPQQREAMLYTVDQMLQATIDSLPAHIAVLDEAGTIIAINAAWRRFGDANDYLGANCGLGANYLEVCERAIGDDANVARAAAQGIRAVIADEQAEFSLEYPCHSADERRWFLMQALRFVGYRPARAIVTHENITQRKQIESWLSRSETTYRTLIEHLPVATYIAALDQDSTMLYVSPQIETMLGFTQDEWIADPTFWLKRVHPHDRARVLADVAAFRESLTSIPSEFRLIAKDGGMVWVRHEAAVVRGKDGQPLFLQGITQNITQRKQAEHALDETRRRLQALFDNAQDAFLLIDDEGRYVDANPAALALSGYTREELLRLTINDLTPVERRAHQPKRWQAFLSAGRASDEFTLLRKDGSTIEVEYRAIANTVPGLHLSVMRDISERKRAEEAQRRTTARLRSLHEIDRAILAARSSEDIALVALRAIRRLIPYHLGSVVVFDFETRESLVIASLADGEPSLKVGDRYSLDLIPESGAIIERLRRGKVYLLDALAFTSRPPFVDRILAEGLRYHTCVPLIAHGELCGMLQIGRAGDAQLDGKQLEISREIADSVATAISQARLREQVSATSKRLHDLSRQLVEAQELERREIARDLHDRIGQNLTALNINLTIARDRLSPKSAAQVGARLAEALNIVDETVDSIRDVIAELRPAVLDDYGLVAALRWYAKHFARRTELAVLLDIEQPRPAPRLPTDLETALFRITQEALTNVARHAHAKFARVNLMIRDNMIRLAIADDGTGFDLKAPRGLRERWGLGLIDMRERVEALGGRLRIDSAPGQGTQVIIETARQTDGH